MAADGRRSTDAERATRAQGLHGVRQTARKKKRERFTALLHHLSVGLLRDIFYALKRQASPEIDGLTWQVRFTAQPFQGANRRCTMPVSPVFQRFATATVSKVVGFTARRELRSDFTLP